MGSRRKALGLAALTALAIALLPSSASARPAAETQITSGPAEGSTIITPTATFGYSAGLPTDVFVCTLDGAAVACGQGSYTTPPLALGDHVFTVAAKDPNPGSMVVDQTPSIVHFKVGQTPVVIDPGPTKASRSGKFGIKLSCPATAVGECSGTLTLSSSKALLKPSSLPFTLTPGQTLGYTAKAGKSGSAKVPRSLAAAAKQGNTGRTKRFAVDVAASQSGAPTVDGTYSAKQTVTVLYKATQGKSGSAKK